MSFDFLYKIMYFEQGKIKIIYKMSTKKLTLTEALVLAAKLSITKEEVLLIVNSVASNEQKQWIELLDSIEWQKFPLTDLVFITENTSDKEAEMTSVVLEMIPWKKLLKKELLSGLKTITNTSIIAKIISSGRFDEATILATLKKHNNDFEIVVEAIKSKKLSISELQKIGKKQNNELIWGLLVLSHVFSNRQLLNIGKKANSSSVWKTIIKSTTLSEKELLEISNHTKNKSVRKLISSCGDFSFDQKQLLEA